MLIIEENPALKRAWDKALTLLDIDVMEHRQHLDRVASNLFDGEPPTLSEIKAYYRYIDRDIRSHIRTIATTEWDNLDTRRTNAAIRRGEHEILNKLESLEHLCYKLERFEIRQCVEELTSPIWRTLAMRTKPTPYVTTV